MEKVGLILKSHWPPMIMSDSGISPNLKVSTRAERGSTWRGGPKRESGPI